MQYGIDTKGCSGVLSGLRPYVFTATVVSLVMILKTNKGGLLAIRDSRELNAV